MSDEYYYSQAGQRCGPVPGEQLKLLAASGQLQPTDLIWKEGMSGWVAAAKVKGLFPAPPEPARPSDPPTAPLPPNSQSEAAGPASGSAGDAARTQSRQAKEAAMAAGSHALQAFQVLIRNPVGGLREAFEALGKKPALSVGILFAAVFLLCFLVGGWIQMSGIPKFSVLWRQIVFGLVPIASCMGLCFAAQAIFRGERGIEAAAFVTGTSLLPVGAAMLLLAILASMSYLINAAVWILAFTTTTLMTYNGCTTLLGLSETTSTYLVPSILIVDIVAYKVVIYELIPSLF